MNPFNSSAVSKEERMPVSAPSGGVDVVADDALFSGMLADVLVAAEGDPSGGENENAPDSKKNNSTGEDVQNPVVMTMALPELAPESPPMPEACLETWCASVKLSENAGAQSPTRMNGEAAMQSTMRTETTASLLENKQSVSESGSRSDVQDSRTGSPVATVRDEASPEGNKPFQIVQLPSAPSAATDDSKSLVPSDTEELLPSDSSTSTGLSSSTTNSSPREPGKWAMSVPAEKTEIALPAETRVVKPVAASDDPIAFTVSTADETSENAPSARRTGAGLPLNVSVPSVGPEDDQVASAGPDSVARKKATAVYRADKGTQVRRPSLVRTSGGQAEAAGRGTAVDEGETTSASSQVGGDEAGSLREENIIALNEGMRPRTPDEQNPVTLRSGMTTQVLNASKMTGDSALSRTDGGVAPRSVPGHILSRVEQFEEFVSRLDQHILSTSANREKTMTVTLVPESLGKVVLNCREQGGQLWVEIQAANPSVREVLQRQEEVIRQMMDQSGCKLMQFDVHSQTGEGNLGHFRRQSQENEEAAEEEGYARPVGRGLESEPVVTASPTELRRGLWVVA